MGEIVDKIREWETEIFDSAISGKSREKIERDKIFDKRYEDLKARLEIAELIIRAYSGEIRKENPCFLPGIPAKMPSLKTPRDIYGREIDIDPGFFIGEGEGRWCDPYFVFSPLEKLLRKYESIIFSSKIASKKYRDSLKKRGISPHYLSSVNIKK